MSKSSGGTAMRIIFVRHGEPDYDNDILTPNGIRQAESTSARIKDEGISAVYSSPMGRARQTASYTASALGLEVKTLDFMHEIDWGGVNGAPLEYDGHPWTLAFELYADAPEYAEGSRWREHHFFRDNICTSYYDSVSSKLDAFLETYGLRREGGCYRALRECSDTIALFAHGGSGAVLFSHLLGLPFPFVLTSLPYGVCSVSIFDLTPQSKDIVVPRLELFNEMGHLGDVRQEKLRFEK